MYCTKCGSEMPDGSKFCTACGESMTDSEGGATEETAVAERSSSAVNSKKNKAKLGIVIALALVVIAMVVVIVVNAHQSHQEEIARKEAQAAFEAEKTVQEAIDVNRVQVDLADQPSLMEGVASNQFVDEDAYDLVSFTIDDRHVDSASDTMMISGEVVIRNDFFEETSKVEVSYSRAEGGYSIDDVIVYDSVVVPLRGISQDVDHGIVDVDPEFDASEMTCVATAEPSSQDTWFGKMETATQYAYRFEDTGWLLDEETSETVITDASGIFGSYSDDRGEVGRDHGCFNSFSVSHKDDAAADIILVDYTWVPFTGAASTGRFMELEAGSVNCQVELQVKVDADGNLFADKTENTAGFWEALGIFSPGRVDFVRGAWYLSDDTGQRFELNMNGVGLTKQ